MTLAIILAMLKQEYASTIGLSDKSFNALAEQLLTQLGDSATGEQAEEAVKAIGATLKVIQTEADIHRAKIKRELEKKKADGGSDTEKDPTKKDGASPGNENPNPEQGNGAPEWFKAYAKESNEQIKALTEQLTAIKAKETTGTRTQKFEAILEGLPDAVKTSQLKDFGRISFKDDEDFESWMTEKKTDLEGLKSSIVAEDATKFGPSTPKSTGGGGNNKTASKEEIADVLSQFNL